MQPLSEHPNGVKILVHFVAFLACKAGRNKNARVNDEYIRVLVTPPPPNNVTPINIQFEQAHFEEYLSAERMKSVEQLATGISHEFNNIFMVVGTYTEFLRESIPKESQAEEDLQVIADGVKRASSLVSRLMAFVGRQKQTLETLRLNEVVTAAKRELEEIAGNRIKLQLEVSDDIAPIYADRDQLKCVLLNLSKNACEAMSERGRLTIRTRTQRRRLSHHADLTINEGLYSVLSVEDTGMGIHRDDTGRIFEPFFSSKGKRGSGLGLSEVYGIVKQSGGHITVESTPNRKTVFEVFFPACHEPPDE